MDLILHPPSSQSSKFTHPLLIFAGNEMKRNSAYRPVLQLQVKPETLERVRRRVGSNGEVMVSRNTFCTLARESTAYGESPAQNSSCDLAGGNWPSAVDTNRWPRISSVLTCLYTSTPLQNMRATTYEATTCYFLINLQKHHYDPD